MRIVTILFAIATASISGHASVLHPPSTTMKSISSKITSSILENATFPRTDSLDLRSTDSLESLIPRPMRNWYGDKRPDYNTMYRQYTVPLHCGRQALPIGLFGFYFWIGMLFTLVSNVLTAFRVMGLDGAKDPHLASRRLHALGGFTWYIWSTAWLLYRNIHCQSSLFGLSVNDPTGAVGSGNTMAVMAKFLIAMIPGNSLAAGLTIALMYSNPKNWILGCLAIGSLVYKFFVTVMFYYGYTNFLYADEGIWQPLVAACVPVGILFLVATMILTFAAGNEDGWLGFGLFWAGLLITFHVACVGIAFVLLGRTVNDPWGHYIVTSKLGIVNVILASVFPTFSIATAGIGGA